ncbi:histidine phosphatase family protein [Bacillus sp. FJAT-42376]|uniref:histidine phosphatase family protein n=1 Tax=Bacillus sp. FJAT-42376 TaxID=2014076 RepID=UPI000F4D61F6|nr:histidine phosphatase family protein [Bacillus sp. FJAT-42376]AZB44470.1 histidine phosphatase family protein [Bacillus sp. FJAT-42376]
MTKLGIIRHGITEWNMEGRAQGSSDIPLHAKGLKEAEMLADRLKEEKWDLLYSSPLMRAKQTAEFISEKLGGLEIITDDRIRETGGGRIEGTTEAERLEKWGIGWRDLDLGRERSEDVVKRGLEFAEDLVEKHPEKNILVVSHGSFIRHLLQALVPAEEELEALKNTSITHLILEDTKWSCGLYNCTKHLSFEIE